LGTHRASAAIAALLAVAITLLAGTAFHSTPAGGGTGSARHRVGFITPRAPRHAGATPGHAIRQLTGAAQPDAVGRVFIDGRNGKWYFFLDWNETGGSRENL